MSRLQVVAASIVVAGRVNGLSESACRDAACRAATSYRMRIRSFADMRYLDIWYSSIEATEVTNRLNDDDVAEQLVAKANKKTNVGTLPKLVELRSSGPRIRNDPPLIDHHTYPLAQRIPILARHADPRTTEHDDRARGNLDRHAVHILTAYVAGV